MIKLKAWNASNSRAIAKFHNAEIGHFGQNAFIHGLIRGFLDNGDSEYLYGADQSFNLAHCLLIF